MKITKKLATLLLSLLLILSMSFNVFAEETMSLSPWALPTLNEGERYGIYPIEWYYDNFNQPITEEKLDYLVAKVDEKLGKLDVTPSKKYNPNNFSFNNSRGHVITALYNTVLKYEMLNASSYSPVEYMLSHGVLAGSENGLDLEGPCTVEQAAVMATKLVENTYNLANAGSLGFLWKVAKNNNTVYLLGSIHKGSADLYPFHKSIKEPLYNSNVLVVELNAYDQSGLQSFLSIASCEKGKTLKDYVSAETYERVSMAIQALGYPVEIFDAYKPWSVANDLTNILTSMMQSAEEAAKDSQLGIDLYYMSSAVVNQIPIGELEGYTYQAYLFDGLSKEYQEKSLLEVANEIIKIANGGELSEEENESAEAVKLMQDYWIKGDLASFKEYYGGIISDSEDELSQMLFGLRDENMAMKVMQLLNADTTATYFVVAGSGHFTVDNTVIDILIKNGYDVEYLR